MKKLEEIIINPFAKQVSKKNKNYEINFNSFITNLCLEYEMKQKNHVTDYNIKRKIEEYFEYHVLKGNISEPQSKQFIEFIINIMDLDVEMDREMDMER